MRDHGLGADPAAFRLGIEQLQHSLALGDQVLLHCAAGIGRNRHGGGLPAEVPGPGHRCGAGRRARRRLECRIGLQSGWIQQF